LFDQALGLDPDNLDALVGRGRINAELVAAGLSDDREASLSAAETALIGALSRAPKHPWAHTWMGLVYLQTNRAQQATAKCEQALALDRNLAHAYNTIGLAKVVIGRAEETEAHVRKALRLSPRDSNAYIWLMGRGSPNSPLATMRPRWSGCGSR
jgi:tetratricopeptide (TPR) repeat protein